MLCVYAIIESGACTLTTSTKRKIIPASHEIKEKELLVYTRPPPKLGLISLSWNLSRLESQGWIGVGSRQARRCPSLTPLLNLHYLACPGWNQNP